ncbi:MAG: 50S ribosomal protein L9, partial [Pseudomonadota bacterium]
MDVVLLERVAKLGQMGDVVAVKPGYARNFLLPQGKALRATKANIAGFEAQRAQLEARNLEAKGEAERVAGELDGQQFVVIRSASEAGALYGSVTARDAAEAAIEGGFTVDRKQVVI